MEQKPGGEKKLRKPQENPYVWIGIFMAVGAGLGVAMGNIAIGVGIGAAIGTAVGAAQSQRSKGDSDK